MSLKDATLLPKFLLVSLHSFISIFLLIAAATRNKFVAYFIVPYVVFLWIAPLYVLFNYGYIEFDILVISFLSTEWGEVCHFLTWKLVLLLLLFLTLMYSSMWAMRHYISRITSAYHYRILITAFLYIGITSAIIPIIVNYSPKVLIPLVTNYNTKEMSKEEIKNYTDNLVPQILNPAYPSYIYRSLIPFQKQLSVPYYTWKFYEKFSLMKSENINSFECNCDDDITVILFIGESYRSDHASWNGYFRQTLPLLSNKKANIINFPYVASYQTSTVPSIFGILSDATCENRKATMTSFISIMKKHGFSADLVLCRTTNWHYVPNIHSVLDGQLDSSYMAEDTNSMVARIEEIASRHGRKMIIVEDGLGHSPYIHSAQFNVFGKKTAVDKYDNTLVQADDVMNRIINIIENKNSVFFYTSDHGQSFGEQGYWMHGASLSIEKQRHVFTFLWYSSSYNENHGELLNIVKNNSTKYITHGDIYYTILSLSGLECDTINALKYNLTKPLPDRDNQHAFILQNN